MDFFSKLFRSYVHASLLPLLSLLQFPLPGLRPLLRLSPILLFLSFLQFPLPRLRPLRPFPKSLNPNLLTLFQPFALNLQNNKLHMIFLRQPTRPISS